MREKALGYLIIFTGFLVLTKAATGWMWYRIYFLADKSPIDAVIYRKKVWYNPKKFYDWLIKNTSEEKAIRKLFIGYYLCELPVAVSIIITVIGLFTPYVDHIMDVASFIILGFNMIMLIIGAIQGSKRFYH